MRVAAVFLILFFHCLPDDVLCNIAINSFIFPNSFYFIFHTATTCSESPPQSCAEREVSTNRSLSLSTAMVSCCLFIFLLKLRTCNWKKKTKTYVGRNRHNFFGSKLAEQNYYLLYDSVNMNIAHIPLRDHLLAQCVCTDCTLDVNRYWIC